MKGRFLCMADKQQHNYSIFKASVELHIYVHYRTYTQPWF